MVKEYSPKFWCKMKKNAQLWINKKYPTKEEKEKVKVLSINSLNKYWPFALYGDNGKDGDCYFRIGKREIEGELDLTEFTNLENLCIRQNEINNIRLGNGDNITELVISGTLIKELNLGSQFNLNLLSISDANQLLVLDLSQNTKLLSLLIEYCESLEKIEGLGKLKLVFSSVIKGNSKLNSSDYEKFCIPDRPWSNFGLPQGWQDFFNLHAEEINSKPKKVAWIIAMGIDGSESSKKAWENHWYDLTMNGSNRGIISCIGGAEMEDSDEDNSDKIDSMLNNQNWLQENFPTEESKKKL